MDMRSRFLPQGWYPESEADCRREIESFGKYFQEAAVEVKTVHGGIVPHAGWFFSGRLAALVFHVCAVRFSPEVVVLFGGHLGPGTGIIYNDKAWETPLGALDVDLDLAAALMKKTKVRPEGPRTNDNTIEVQTPLVKYFFPNSRLLAVRVPHSELAVEIGREVAALSQSQGKSILAFGSTDLTHYGPNYDFQPQGGGAKALAWVKEVNDKGFIQRALGLDFQGMLAHAADSRSACSAGGAVAAAAACGALGAAGGTLADYYTSHDIMPGSSFVGYAGIVY
ncbi:MAG: AmmeMemoRadiSam system protein B [Pseudomonadota bacterium]